MRIVIVIISLIISTVGFSQKEIHLSSPNRSIVFTFKLNDTGLLYKVTFKEKPVLNYSSIQFNFLEGGAFGKNLKIGKPVVSEINETYELVVGKAKNINSHSRQILIPVEERAGLKRKMNLIVRAFDDGIAFRYEFPEQSWKSYTLTNEHTQFNINGNSKLRTLFLPNYTTSHEGEYSTLLLSQVKEDTLMDLPTLFEMSDNLFLAITEAALSNYAGMYLMKENGMLVSKLSPLPGQSEIKVKASIPHHTPWRVLMISDRIGALVESNILTNLNEPNKISDVSWVRPGKATWPWWNGNVTPDTTFAPGNNFETNKYFIDFCATNKIEYHSIVEYGGHEWYRSDGVNFSPGPNTDATKSVPGLDMQQVCDYARSKGVGIRVWVHWQALYRKLEEAFTQYEKWGISGLMVDFMDRDDQEMVNIQEEILRRAAAHKLHIQFHGAYKPTGMHRTWPNEFTREGVMNYEYDKWSDLMTPDHDINVVFTRLLAGPTDYHLGGFRAVPKSKFKIQYTKPLVMGTRAHMLAMYVVLESYLSLLSDYPDAYIGQAGFDFLKEVPTTWDETRVLDAKVGEWITIARRINNDWYIGTINNSTPRQLNINLNFLPEGNFEAKIYSDTPDAEQNPNNLKEETKIVKTGDAIGVKLVSGGGQVMQLKRQ
jgi:alpha-glucosidase